MTNDDPSAGRIEGDVFEMSFASRSAAAMAKSGIECHRADVSSG